MSVVVRRTDRYVLKCLMLLMRAFQQGGWIGFTAEEAYFYL